MIFAILVSITSLFSPVLADKWESLNHLDEPRLTRYTISEVKDHGR